MLKIIKANGQQKEKRKERKRSRHHPPGQWGAGCAAGSGLLDKPGSVPLPMPSRAPWLPDQLLGNVPLELLALVIPMPRWPLLHHSLLSICVWAQKSQPSCPEMTTWWAAGGHSCNDNWKFIGRRHLAGIPTVLWNKTWKLCPSLSFA